MNLDFLYPFDQCSDVQQPIETLNSMKIKIYPHIKEGVEIGQSSGQQLFSLFYVILHLSRHLSTINDFSSIIPDTEIKMSNTP